MKTAPTRRLALKTRDQMLMFRLLCFTAYASSVATECNFELCKMKVSRTTWLSMWHAEKQLPCLQIQHDVGQKVIHMRAEAAASHRRIP
jgi:hypothetical protein